jgi:hypothetical protein
MCLTTTRNFELLLGSCGISSLERAFRATLTYAGLGRRTKFRLLISLLTFKGGFGERQGNTRYELPRLQVQILRSGTSGVEARADIDSWCIDFGFCEGFRMPAA